MKILLTDGSQVFDEREIPDDYYGHAESQLEDLNKRADEATGGEIGWCIAGHQD